MLLRRRVYQAIPILLLVTLVVAYRIIHHDPWRSNTFLGWIGADVYYQRSIVFMGDGVMIALSLATDLGITLGCLLLAFSYWVHRTHRLEINPEAVLIMACSFGLLGLTHLLNTVTMYSGIYLLDLLVRSAAAAACCVTAVYTAKALLSRTRR